MLKKYISALVASALVFALSGCKSEEKRPEVSLSVWCDEKDIPMTEKMIEAFKEEYKSEAEFSVTVSAEGEDTCKNTILASPDAAADVFAFANDQFEELYNAGVLLEISENADKIIAENGGANDNAIICASAGGKLFACPITASNGYFLYYNREYLTEDDVKSFDKILDVAAKNGKKMTMDFSSGWYTYSFFKGAGLDVGLNDDGVTNHCDWNAAGGKFSGRDVAEAMLRIASHEGFLSAGDAELKSGAADGSVIAGISGTWISTDMEAAMGKGYAAAKLPEYTIKGEKAQMCSFTGYKLMGVNARSKEPKWAIRLAQWLTNEQNQAERFRVKGERPANTKAAASDEVKASAAISALGAQSPFADLQKIGGAYWDATSSFGLVMAAKNPDNIELQKLLDDMCEGITAK